MKRARHPEVSGLTHKKMINSEQHMTPLKNKNLVI